MSRYIDAEKLKRFVGELKKEAKRNCCDSWGIVPEALEKVEGFITSLQQEQPEVDEIELDGMAIDFRNTIKPKPHTNLYYEDQIYNAYKAGFRKGLNARKEE